MCSEFLTQNMCELVPAQPRQSCGKEHDGEHAMPM